MVKNSPNHVQLEKRLNPVTTNSPMHLNDYKCSDYKSSDYKFNILKFTYSLALIVVDVEK